MKIEVRADNTVHVEGYVNVPGRDSRPLRDGQGVYIEQVTPGTFGKALAAGNPVELRFNHQRTLGSTTDGTIELREDAVGLHASAVIQDGELVEKARRKELRGWSFGFVKRADRWEGESPRRRYLDEIELREVSILDKTPAYIATSIETRDGDDVLVEFREDPEEPDYQVEETTVIDTQRKTMDSEGESQMRRVTQTIEFYKRKRRERHA